MDRRRANVIESPREPRFEDEPGLVEEVAPGKGVEIGESRLVDVDLSGAKLAGLRLTDVIVERGNLANMVAPEISVSRAVITGARLTGAQWTRGRLVDVLFRDCRIDLATFAGTTLERVAFSGCMLAHADFREGLLRSVRFDHCDLTEADLTGLRIDRCELRSCTLDRLTGVERLRGAAMPWPDVLGHAGLLATALGIRVLDEDER